MSDPAPASEALRSWANLPCGDVDDMEPIGLGGETRLMTREEVLGAPDAADATADAEDSPFAAASQQVAHSLLYFSELLSLERYRKFLGFDSITVKKCVHPIEFERC